MPTRKPAGASARSAARKCAPRKKPAPAKPKPQTNSAHYKPAPRKKPAAPRRKTARKTTARKMSPHVTRRVTPFGVITVRSGRPLAYSADLKAHARHRFEETPESAYSIAADLGMHHVSLKRLAQREGWVRRNPPPLRGITGVMRLADEVEALAKAESSAHSRESGNPAADTEAFELGPVGPRFRGDEGADDGPDTSAIDRLEAAVLKELAVVERMRAALGPEPLRPFDAQITARTLASLTETVSKLRRLRLAAQPHSGPTDDNDIPADIDEFRRELARRIEAFVASQPDDECTDGDRVAVVDAPRPA
jgi:hypothetical protein